MSVVDAFGDLKPHHYMVVRRFGQNRLYRVMSAPTKSCLGWRVGVTEVKVNYQGWADESDINYVLRKFGPVRGRPLFEVMHRIPRWTVLDIIVGRPWLRMFESKHEAIEQMKNVPNFDVPTLMAYCLTRWFPGWLAIIVFVIVGFVLDFVDPRRSLPL